MENRDKTPPLAPAFFAQIEVSAQRCPLHFFFWFGSPGGAPPLANLANLSRIAIFPSLSVTPGGPTESEGRRVWNKFPGLLL